MSTIAKTLDARVEVEPEEALWPYLALGGLFGVILTKSEVISWYRIQEMFRFESFHMYGIIGTAVIVAAVSMAVLRARNVSSFHGENIRVTPKAMGTGRRYAFGGTLFGLGWGLTGACPGPMVALVGNGIWGALLVLLGALLGTWVYAHVRSALPH